MLGMKAQFADICRWKVAGLISFGFDYWACDFKLTTVASQIDNMILLMEFWKGDH